jgi:hypothetical protein
MGQIHKRKTKEIFRGSRFTINIRDNEDESKKHL